MDITEILLLFAGGVLAGYIRMGVNAGHLAESDITPGQFPVNRAAISAGAIESLQPVSLASWLLGLVAMLLLLEAWLAWR